jgi:pimeloyl-ACP methyl ester carboxylesterase
MKNTMITHRHVTAPTLRVEAAGIFFAYRRFGKPSAIPLVLLQHFRGGLDNWDPLLIDELARDREVILVDGAGVSGSSGETPDSIEAMAEDIHHFLSALSLEQVDLLGISLGGFIAQTVAIKHPSLVRRLILVGTGPRGGELSTDPQVPVHSGTSVPSLEDFLYLFFGHSEAGQTAGRSFWTRRHERQIDVAPASSQQTMDAQRVALTAWRVQSGERYAELARIGQPTLVVNGDADVMVPTVNSITLQQNIPNAQLILYPDSGHGSLFQFPRLFAKHASVFLEG